MSAWEEDVGSEVGGILFVPALGIKRSHTGDHTFPRWESIVPASGIFDKLRVILDKGPLLKNKLPVSENKEALNGQD